jgi:DNA (cytosine-5)-methyltransferase 1
MPMAFLDRETRQDNSIASSCHAVSSQRVLRFIDLFAGLGGTRLGLEAAAKILNIKTQCVLTSEIKPAALQAYRQNFNRDTISGDITSITPSDIPDFDFLLAGFPCQPFSSAGKRKGFLDERGGLFFTILNILTIKKPQGFLLENVEGLATHNGGETLKTILTQLEALNYFVTWQMLDASDFGVPQKRKRIYIVGMKDKKINLTRFETYFTPIESIIDQDAPFTATAFTTLLTQKFAPQDLIGKAIKDKRGGTQNIHSWDLALKGALTATQKELLGEILKKRRYKKWAVQKGMTWMDGMPLTTEEISTFFKHPTLQVLLDDLTAKGYLTLEHPREQVMRDGVTQREPAKHIPKGYNIVAGKLSYELSKILDPKGLSPTLVATEAGKIGVIVPQGVRKLTVREGLRLSGFPEDYTLEGLDYQACFDLIGNTIMPPVVQHIALRMLG